MAASPRPPPPRLRRARQVTLIATGGLRRPQDIVKALALGADTVAVSNVAPSGVRLR
ncbi:MAG: alpha-hydroxy-acid oxidizing protein [Actinomycetales bacterium]|nr:alpha-hydroxy-acid oxidizing protein [Candidatus Lutibacillus vidarii]